MFVRVRLGIRPETWCSASAGKEVFRLPGVSRPESWRQICWKSRGAFLGVQQARQQQASSV